MSLACAREAPERVECRARWLLARHRFSTSIVVAYYREGLGRLRVSEAVARVTRR